MTAPERYHSLSIRVQFGQMPYKAIALNPNSGMIVLFHPAHLRFLFTNRERELELLHQATTSLADGRPRHLAIFGLRRIGKTLLLLEHAVRLLNSDRTGSVRPAYLDLEELEAFLTPTALLGGPAAGPTKFDRFSKFGLSITGCFHCLSPGIMVFVEVRHPPHSG